MRTYILAIITLVVSVPLIFYGIHSNAENAPPASGGVAQLSKTGNISPIENPVACETNEECKDPRGFMAAPGGLPYGCLPDVKLCGYLYPPSQENGK